MLSMIMPNEKNKIGSFKIPEFHNRMEGVKKINHFKIFSFLGKKSTIALNKANKPIKLNMQKNRT